MDKEKDLLKTYWLMCFELWRWRWQVDLEEDMDNNYFDAFLWVLHDKKTAMPLHTVSCDWLEKAVKYKLRSEKWKKWVKKTTKTEMKDNLELFYNLIFNK